mgnify:CR=1 FL=1
MPAADELRGSPMLRHPEFQAEVERWIAFWTEGRGGRWFPEYLARMGAFEGTVDEALEETGLPAMLRYLPVVESGYSLRAVSSASAVGLWQFMAPTARGYGMEVSALRDERRNPFKATTAATRFLGSLRDRFGSWHLALAAYNSGPGRVQGVIRRHAPLRPRSDSLYWELRPHLPRETRDFVPKLYAAAWIAENPERYGIPEPAPLPPFAFDEVTVPDATTLDVVARAAGVDQEAVEHLNPELVRGITPPGQETVLRVPPGSADRFQEEYALIPPSERVSFVEHRVQPGETLGHIAIRYGVPVREVREANPDLRPRYLQIGQRIIVPIAPLGGRTEANRAG